MTITIATFLDRLKAMEEAIDLTTVDNDNAPVAFTAAIYRQDTFPYWTNELISVTPTGQDYAHDKYNVVIRAKLFRGRVGEGFSRNLENACQQDVFTVIPFFRLRKNMSVATGGAAPAGFIPNSLTITSQGATRLSDDEYGSIYDISVAIGDRAGA
jgi:hypothetical protein